MTMRTRAPRAPRMEKLFTTTEVALTLVAGNISITSQQSTNQITSDFEARSGRQARGITPIRQWVTGLWFTQAVVTNPVVIGLAIGMGIFSSGIDSQDFPDLATHTGEWFYHRTWRLTDRGITTSQPTLLTPSDNPANGSSFSHDNRTGRKIQRVSQELFLVIQKDVATEENIQFHADITVMWGLS